MTTPAYTNGTFGRNGGFSGLPAGGGLSSLAGAGAQYGTLGLTANTSTTSTATGLAVGSGTGLASTNPPAAANIPDPSQVAATGEFSSIFSQFGITTGLQPVCRNNITNYYFVWGNTIASIIYILRILRVDVGGFVYHGYRGVNHYRETTNISGANGPVANTDLDFGNYVQDQADYFDRLNVVYVPNNDADTDPTNSVSATVNVPVGLGADAMATFPSIVTYVPLLGSNASASQVGLVASNTLPICLTSPEQQLATCLSNSFQVEVAHRLINPGPVILDRNFAFLLGNFDNCSGDNPNEVERNIGQLCYFDLVTNNRLNFARRYQQISNITDVTFLNPGPAGRTYNVQYGLSNNTVVAIPQRCIVRLKSTPYDNIRTATQGGIVSLRAVTQVPRVAAGRSVPNTQLATALPAQYRAVYAVSSALDGMSLSFSLPNMETPTDNTIGWIVQVFTVTTDYRSNTSGGSPNVAAPGFTLLVTEATSLSNERIIYWNSAIGGNGAFQVNLNPGDQEAASFSQFVGIVRTINACLVTAGVSSNLPSVSTVTSGGITTIVNHFNAFSTWMHNGTLQLVEMFQLYPASTVSLP